MKRVTTLTIAAILTASCGGRASNTPSKRITDQNLTGTTWCQTSAKAYYALGDRHTVTLHHRLMFDPLGTLIWQTRGEDGLVLEKKTKIFSCHQNSAVSLVLDDQDATQFLYQISGGALVVNAPVMAVDPFKPCTDADNALFDQP